MCAVVYVLCLESPYFRWRAFVQASEAHHGLSCEGGRNIPKDASGTPLYDRTYFPTHCDASKGHKEIPIKPSDDCEGRFFYDEFGGISSAIGDADAQDTIIKFI